MIKVLIVFFLALLMVALSFSLLRANESSVEDSNSPSSQFSSPSDAIEGAKGAASQTQKLQDKINQEAQNQLNQ